MPAKPKRPCNHPMCPELTTETYCEAHRKQYVREKDKDRPTASQRGYNARWRRARRMFLRKHPFCVHCEQEGKLTPATVVDHIRTVLLDTEMFPSLVEEKPARNLTDWEKRRIIDILWELSDRERQCYLLHMAHGWSMAEIAKELRISKRTVQQYIDRARGKIKQKVS